MAKKENINKYFSHDCNARNSEKIIRLRMKEGAAGYGVFFMLLERLREEPEYSSKKDYDMLSFDFRTDASLVQSVVEDYGLFEISEDGKRFYSKGFKKRMELMDSKKKKLSEAGKRGMATRWNNHLITTLSVNDNKQNKTYNNKQNKNNKETSTIVEVKKDELSSLPSSDCNNNHIDFNAMLKYFNGRFSGKLPTLRIMNEQRKKAVNKMAEKYGKTVVFEVLERAAVSSFLLGDNDRNWRCDFDWIFKPANFIKIYEGNYDNKSDNDSARSRKKSVKNLRELAVAVLQGNATKVD